MRHQPLRATADGYTLDGYRRTGGYTVAAQGAHRHDAGRRWPTRSRTATLLGRGGAGFPAGVKWGFLPARRAARATSWSTATRASRAPTRTACSWSSIRTSSSRASLICLLRRRRGAGLPLRPRRDGAGPGADRARRSTTPTPRATSARTSSAPTSASTSCCTWGAGAYIVGEETGAHREPRGQPGHAPAQAAVLPGGQGPLPAADDRQQRRDAVEPAVDRRPTAATAFTAHRRRGVARACACSPCPAT